MSDLALSVTNLSKSFNIDHRWNGLGGHRTLHDDLMNLPRRMFGRFRQSQRPTSETFWALKDVSFDVRQGEVVGIIGANGTGKSTLLKILNRITEPTSGGADIYGRVGALLEVGTGFHPELTGRENVFLNGAILGMTRAEIKKKFDEIVAFAEIEKFLDTPVKRYSSGMYVRLAFSVAAHLEPEILLIDEVLAVGDASFQKKSLEKMEAVAANDGRTVIFVSHSMPTIARLCPRTIWLQGGEIAADGPSDDVIQKYSTVTLVDQDRVSWPDGFSNASVHELKFKSIGLLDKNGLPTTHFDYSEPLSFELSYTIHESLSFCRIGFVVHALDGTPVFEIYDV
ncbi:MAG TPA: ABC transporter ATP-binding protein, partial [Candidatus Udaeobacter sp.]|nr:ABC transporter ATP-binding protein [Candidatus Udaeobacter sp.]